MHAFMRDTSTLNCICWKASIYDKFTDVVIIFNIKGQHMTVAGDRVRESELSLDEMAAADGVVLTDKWLYNSLHIWMITDQMNFAPQSIWPIDEMTLHSTNIVPHCLSWDELNIWCHWKLVTS